MEAVWYPGKTTAGIIKRLHVSPSLQHTPLIVLLLSKLVARPVLDLTHSRPKIPESSTPVAMMSPRFISIVSFLIILFTTHAAPTFCGYVPPEARCRDYSIPVNVTSLN